jgi:catechol-2,3-dioxygenase
MEARRDTMLRVLRVGYVDFETAQLSSLVDYYSGILGLTETYRDTKSVYLTVALDHHCVGLRTGAESRLLKFGLQIAPTDLKELESFLIAKGVKAKRVTDGAPGIPELVQIYDPDGIVVDLFVVNQPPGVPYSQRGVQPHKLAHLALLTPDVQRKFKFYRDTLGFRFSDSIQDFFYFLRCGVDHHGLNLLRWEHAGLHHLAFEVADVSHLCASTDVLTRAHIPLIWGPTRHGPGHNVSAYHRNPEGQIVELFCEIDRMSNEDLGYFDPRPWHGEFPQRPRCWENVEEAASLWGIMAPPKFLD